VPNTDFITWKAQQNISYYSFGRQLLGHMNWAISDDASKQVTEFVPENA